MPDEPLFEHPLLTTVGLFLEAHAGLTRLAGEALEREAGLSTQWFEVLLRLVRTPGERLRMSELAAQTILSPSGLTRVVDRLVAEGLVERQSCADDRRSAYAALTPAGRERIRAAVGPHLAFLERTVGDVLGERDLRELDRLVRTLRDALNPCAAVPPAAAGPTPG